MSKIVCEICGTQYPDNAAACPICGWAHNDAAAAGAAAAAEEEDFNLDFLNEIQEEKTVAEEVPAAPAAPARRKPREVFDYDAVNTPRAAAKSDDEELDEDEEDEDDEEYDDEDDDEESGGSSVLVVILVILIVALLLTSGFIFWKYYLPNHRASQETQPAEVIDVQPSVETEPEIVTVPCTGLSLVSGMEKLSSEGQHWLLHIKAVPEDTTDEIMFMSEDASVVTVNEEGRVTAVGEGETRIVITCGDQKIECPAVVDYTPEETMAVEETLAAAGVEIVETAPEATEAAGAQEEAAEESAAPAEEGDAPVRTDVTLKLKRTDITFGVRGVYVELALDCDLTADQVEWSSRNANVASVNKKGEVTAVGPGLTVITAKYGDQSVECVVRCNF